jgi:UDP-N-acetylglucosamine acyltransferase
MVSHASSHPHIHPTALVDARAEIDSSVTIGPYTVIGPHVQVGQGTRIGAHCVVEGRTTIGCHNEIFQFNSIGAIPQDKKYAGEPTALVIGDHNTIREFCTFNLGVPAAGGITRVGNHNWIMAYTHVAHDCQIDDHTTLANNTTLGGHVHLADGVTIGGLTGIHQFVKVGAYAMVGFASAVSQDVPPYMMVDGNPLAVRGINSVGLRRRDFSAVRIATVKQMHKLLYREGRTLANAQAAIAALPVIASDDAEAIRATADIALMHNFLAMVERGIAR